VKLLLTCKLSSEDNPGSYHAENASELVRRLGITDNVVELGHVPYVLLHRVYGACDIYVTPAYAESFAHPLVEAMASGLPIVASGLPVHQEICGNAAVYFDPFSAEEACEQILRVALSNQLSRDMASRGELRSKDFSWRHHVDQIVTLAGKLSGRATSVQP
jgi:glycosyltransferase involved in cell wall biosynthesis